MISMNTLPTVATPLFEMEPAASRGNSQRDSVLREPHREAHRRVARVEVIVDATEEDRFGDDLLPWADPYIASLMATLQREEQQQ